MNDSTVSANEMKTSEALQWLVRFATTDLDHLRRGDLLNLLDEIRRYLDVAGDGQIDTELRKAEGNTLALAKAAKVARQIVETVADGKQARIPYGKGDYVLDASGARIATYEGSSLRDAILHTAAGDLDSEEKGRIKRCPRCNKVFYGQTNQLYCSRNCAAAVAVKKYREGLARKKAERGVGADERASAKKLGRK